jgi:hypothetical protein
MSTRLLIGLVSVLALCVGLAASNPTWADYLHFLEQTLGPAAETGGGNSGLVGALLQSQNRAVVEAVVRSQTQRRDYGLFSLYETTLWDVRLVMLGVGGRFLPVSGLDEAQKKLQSLKPPPAPR